MSQMIGATLFIRDIKTEHFSCPLRPSACAAVGSSILSIFGRQIYCKSLLVWPRSLLGIVNCHGSLLWSLFWVSQIKLGLLGLQRHPLREATISFPRPNASHTLRLAALPMADRPRSRTIRERRPWRSGRLDESYCDVAFPAPPPTTTSSSGVSPSFSCSNGSPSLPGGGTGHLCRFALLDGMFSFYLECSEPSFKVERHRRCLPARPYVSDIGLVDLEPLAGAQPAQTRYNEQHQGIWCGRSSSGR